MDYLLQMAFSRARKRGAEGGGVRDSDLARRIPRSSEAMGRSGGSRNGNLAAQVGARDALDEAGRGDDGPRAVGCRIGNDPDPAAGRARAAIGGE
jgi:hypothetical protein